MKVLLANPRGFCAGVDRAVKIVDQALEVFGPPVYVRREIVHNSHVVKGLREKGAIFVEELSEVPEGAVAILSAHGVAPEVFAEAQRRSLRLIDATCPLVTKVHLEVQRFVARGYYIILIGHRGHDEVVGTIGAAPDRIVLVEDEEQARRVEVPWEGDTGGDSSHNRNAETPKRRNAEIEKSKSQEVEKSKSGVEEPERCSKALAAEQQLAGSCCGGGCENSPKADSHQQQSHQRLIVLTQTTLGVDDTAGVLKALRERFPHLELPPTDDICYATQNRQDAVKAMTERGIEVLLVVGSPNSSNAARLVEVGRARGVRGYLIDHAAEIRPEWLGGVGMVGVTAGASTPESVVQDILGRLRTLGADSVELCVTAEEDTVFQLPPSLKVPKKAAVASNPDRSPGAR